LTIIIIIIIIIIIDDVFISEKLKLLEISRTVQASLGMAIIIIIIIIIIINR